MEADCLENQLALKVPVVALCELDLELISCRQHLKMAEVLILHIFLLLRNGTFCTATYGVDRWKLRSQ